MPDIKENTPSQSLISRRRALGYLGAAAGGALFDRAISSGGGDTDDIPEVEQSEPQEAIAIDSETATEVKLRAANLAKRAFTRDGYSGVRQADTLSAELWNQTTRLTLTLDFKAGKGTNVLDFNEADLSSVSVEYATLDGHVGAGEGEDDHTQYTIPPISAYGGGKNAFKVNLIEDVAKFPYGHPAPTKPIDTSTSREYFVVVEHLDINNNPSSHDADWTPQSVLPTIFSAFEQFE